MAGGKPGSIEVLWMFDESKVSHVIRSLARLKLAALFFVQLQAEPPKFDHSIARSSSFNNLNQPPAQTDETSDQHVSVNVNVIVTANVNVSVLVRVLYLPFRSPFLT